MLSRAAKPSRSRMRRLVAQLAEELEGVELEGFGINNTIAFTVVLPAAAVQRLQEQAKAAGRLGGTVALFCADCLVQRSHPEMAAALPAPDNWRLQKQERATSIERKADERHEQRRAGNEAPQTPPMPATTRQPRRAKLDVPAVEDDAPSFVDLVEGVRHAS